MIIIGGFSRFQPEDLGSNLKLVEKVEELALKKGCTPAQLALSWIRARSGTEGVAGDDSAAWSECS